eukprot:PLAT3689.3.p1 GENE.PLAT3689.3~~PLAT3689.3.p1  ORF type:complete len:1033 (+),score=392.11 PLAT3689.3:44-3142(+)
MAAWPADACLPVQLLAKVDDVNALVGEDEQTLLMYGVCWGSLPIVQRLLALGASPTICAADGFNPLQRAVLYSHEAIVEALLAAGVSPDSGGAKAAGRLVSTAVGKFTALLRSINRVSHLARCSPLHIAAREGSEAMTKLLLEAGASMKHRTTPLLNMPFAVAAANGFIGVLRLLVQQQLPTGDSHALLLAAGNGHLAAVRFLSQFGARMSPKNATGREDMSPLLHAVGANHADVVLFLLQHGVDVCEELPAAAVESKDDSDDDDDGDRAGHPQTKAAASFLPRDKGSAELGMSHSTRMAALGLRTLSTRGMEGLDAGRLQSMRDVPGTTALHVAAREGLVDMVHLLLQHAAREADQPHAPRDMVDAVNSRGESALFLTSELPVIKLLLQHGADVRLRRTIDGRSRLEMCMWLKEEDDIVSALLSSVIGLGRLSDRSKLRREQVSRLSVELFRPVEREGKPATSLVQRAMAHYRSHGHCSLLQHEFVRMAIDARWDQPEDEHRLLGTRLQRAMGWVQPNARRYMIGQCVWFLFFLTLFMTFVMLQTSSDSRALAQLNAQVAVAAGGEEWEAIGDRAALQAFLLTTLPVLWQAQPDNMEEWKLSDFNAILGGVRLRQWRYTPRDGVALQDTFGSVNYSSPWSSAFDWHSAAELRASPVCGQLACYAAGSYTLDVGYNASTAAQAVTGLLASGWLTDNTQAVAVQFATNNPNIRGGIITVGMLLAELPPSGGVIASKHMRSYKLKRYSTNLDSYLLLPLFVACTAFFLAYVIRGQYWVYQETRHGDAAERKGTGFWDKMQAVYEELFLYSKWAFFNGLVDLAVQLLFFTWAVLHIVNVVIGDNLLRRMSSSPMSFYSLRGLAYWNQQEHNCMAALALLFSLQLARYLKVSRTMGIFVLAVVHMVEDASKFLLVYGVFVLGFTLSFHIALSAAAVEGFHTLMDSFSSLNLMLFGDFDYHSIAVGNGALGPLLVALFFLISVLLLLNLLIAVLCDAYGAVKEAAEVEWSMELANQVLDYEKLVEAYRFELAPGDAI